MSNDGLRVLASQETLIKRRTMLRGVFAGVVGTSLLSACGSSDSSAGSGGDLGSALNIYSFSSYDNPKVLDQFGAKYGPKITVDAFASAEEMVAKLSAAQGTAGYDLVTSPSAYVQTLGEKGIFAELDKSKIPSFDKYSPSLLDRDFDPGNKYSVPKATGTTGFLYDRTVIDRDLKDWADFLDAAQNEASGKTSMIDDARTMTGPYFWANGIDWNTTDTDDLDACAAFFDDFAPNVKYYDSSPGSSGKIASGELALVQAFNGDMRQGVIAEKDPDKWQAVFPEVSEVWIDNWALVADAPNTEAAYAFIEYLLRPVVAMQETEFIGYSTGRAGVQDLAVKNKVKYPELVFFDDADMTKWTLSEVNSGRERLVEIWTDAKANAGG